MLLNKDTIHLTSLHRIMAIILLLKEGNLCMTVNLHQNRLVPKCPLNRSFIVYSNKFYTLIYIIVLQQRSTTQKALLGDMKLYIYCYSYQCVLCRFVFNVSGGGSELPMHYPQWKRISVDVPPVKNLLLSLQKLIDGMLNEHQVV